jgi:hypothetical protein
MPLFAHAGHILIDAPLFLGPVFVLGGALYVSTRRQRQRDGKS